MIIHAWNWREYGRPVDLQHQPNNGPCECGAPFTVLGDYGYWIDNEWQPRCFCCYRASGDYYPGRTEAPEH